jgi:nicotinamide-nucleotide amidase
MDAATHSSFDLAFQIGEKLKAKHWQLATAESCTGGLVGKYLTDISGSSAWYTCGFITYSNQAKMHLLQVRAQTLESFGAVSEQTALEMAKGAIQNSDAQIAISITGIAGPTGGSTEKPVGMVCFAWASAQSMQSSTQYFDGNREQVREQAARFALQSLLSFLDTA